jgi:N-acetylneuraminate synthase
MSSWKELDAAVKTIRKVHRKLTVLQCTSAYPCPPAWVGLNVLAEMKKRYKLPIGLSDHTLSNYASFAAVALGAVAIEKHLTLSPNMYGSDAKHSLLPEQFADLVTGIRAIEVMLANPVNKNNLERFKEMKTVFEKSLVSTRKIAAGEKITAEKIALKKPGTGLGSEFYDKALGKKAARAIAADALIRKEDIAW